jgi:hypothetical protein
MSQFNLQKKTCVAVNNVTLTGSYQNSQVLDTDTCNFLGLFIQYTGGTEASMNIKVEATLDVSLGLATTAGAATNWYQRVAESTISGTTVITQDVFQIAETTGNFLETIYPIKADGVKISVLGNTLSSAPGTVTIYAVASWV